LSKLKTKLTKEEAVDLMRGLAWPGEPKLRYRLPIPQAMPRAIDWKIDDSSSAKLVPSIPIASFWWESGRNEGRKAIGYFCDAYSKTKPIAIRETT